MRTMDFSLSPGQTEWISKGLVDGGPLPSGWRYTTHNGWVLRWIETGDYNTFYKSNTLAYTITDSAGRMHIHDTHPDLKTIKHVFAKRICQYEILDFTVRKTEWEPAEGHCVGELKINEYRATMHNRPDSDLPYRLIVSDGEGVERINEPVVDSKIALRLFFKLLMGLE